MDPRIREGDQGFRQVIRAFMLPLGGLSVFAVKFLALVGFARKARNQLARVFTAKEKHLPRTNTELHGNQGIFTAKTQRAQRKTSMAPRIREGDQGSRQVIRAFMLLLGGLRVFAVKFLGFGGVLQGMQEISWRRGWAIRWVGYQKKPVGTIPRVLTSTAD